MRFSNDGRKRGRGAYVARGAAARLAIVAGAALVVGLSGTVTAQNRGAQNRGAQQRSAQQSRAAPQAPAVSPEQRATEYAQLMQEIGSLQTYNTRMQQFLQTQQDEIASLGQQVGGLDTTAAEIAPLLQKMYDSLAQFVENDLPFLPDERRERMARLKDLMAQEGGASEKYRRLIEAYQVELEYGRTMSAYKGTLDDGRDADFLHLGRVSLMYRTTDGTESGYWDAQKGAYVADAHYARVIDEALGVAQERTAPDIIIVPVPAAKETRL
jgi:hypothetical protein